MKFDHTDWKILAFEVEKEVFKHWPAISDGFDHHLWKVFALWILNFEFFC